MFGLGVGEIGIILFIALVFIGPKKLPELAKGLGKGMREFQNAMRGINQSLQDPMDEIRNQIQEQANSQPRGEFKDDPAHDQNLPADEAAGEFDNATEYKPESGYDEGHGELTEEELEEQIAKNLGLDQDKKLP